MKTANRAIIVYHPMSPWIAKADLRLYLNDNTVLRTCLRDDDAAMDYLHRHFPDLTDIKVIVAC